MASAFTLSAKKTRDLLQSELYFSELLEHFQWLVVVVVIVIVVVHSVTVEAFFHFA